MALQPKPHEREPGESEGHKEKYPTFLTSMFLRALSHSRWPGPYDWHMFSSELMASVTPLAALANWFCTLGALGSTARAFVASSSLLEETETFRMWPSMSSRL